MKLFERVAARTLAPPQFVTFALEQAGEALAATSRRDKPGKVVVVQHANAAVQVESARVSLENDKRRVARHLKTRILKILLRETTKRRAGSVKQPFANDDGEAAQAADLTV